MEQSTRFSLALMEEICPQGRAGPEGTLCVLSFWNAFPRPSPGDVLLMPVPGCQALRSLQKGVSPMEELSPLL